MTPARIAAQPIADCSVRLSPRIIIAETRVNMASGCESYCGIYGFCTRVKYNFNYEIYC